MLQREGQLRTSLSAELTEIEPSDMKKSTKTGIHGGTVMTGATKITTREVSGAWRGRLGQK